MSGSPSSAQSDREHKGRVATLLIINAKMILRACDRSSKIAREHEREKAMEDSSQKSIYTSQYSETPGAPDKHIQGQVKMKVGTQKMNNTTSFDGVIISLPNTGK